MDKKKPTNAQLQSRIDKAVIHIDRTRNVQEVYFDDNGLRLIDCEDYVVVGTMFHRHVFNKVTATGYSRPAIYVSKMIAFALDNDCTVKDKDGNLSRSYARLFEVLKGKEEKSEYYIAQYVDWYLFSIFCPLYSIDENAASNFRVYFEYIHNIACNNIMLSEHKEGLTNKQYWDEFKKFIDEFMENVTEVQIFEPMSDEEFVKQESEAYQQELIESGIPDQQKEE